MANPAPNVEALLVRVTDPPQEAFCDPTITDAGFLAPSFDFGVFYAIYCTTSIQSRVLLLLRFACFRRSLYALTNVVRARDGEHFNLLTERLPALGL